MTTARVWRPSRAPAEPGVLLLDTHVWLRLLEPALGPLSPALRRLLDGAGADDRLWTSDIAVWEVAQKVAKGKLTLSVPVASWLARATTAPGIRFSPLDRDVLILGTALTDLHGDPADRFFLATAKLRGWTLVTADGALIDWARRERGTSVCDCR